VVMYVNDNNGYLPGTDAWEADWGSTYYESFGAYPWEFSAAQSRWYGDPDLAPPGTFTSVVRWFGVGVLVRDKYLPPSTVVACPDCIPGASWQFQYNDGWSMASAYVEFNGDPNQMWAATGQMAGSYVLNTLPYYNPDPSDRAQGKWGYPGMSGGTGDPSAPPSVQFGSQTALLMCLSSQIGGGTGNGPAYTHNQLGVNVTYIDGHTSWMPLSPQDWKAFAVHDDNSSEFDMNGQWQGFWQKAAQFDHGNQ
jgi:hypothetical protein